MNILALGAHPDDIELMAGGTLLKWIAEGHFVHAITLSDGVWLSPNDNTSMRKEEEAILQQNQCAAFIGYSVDNFELQAMDLQHTDEIVRKVLQRVEKYNIDTIICPFDKDLHHDHEIVSRIAITVSRRVKRVLMGQINSFLREVFTPNVFVDITDTWDKKIQAIQHYQSEWQRSGRDWYEFLDATSIYYGKMIGVRRAEGFITKKYLL